MGGERVSSSSSDEQDYSSLEHDFPNKLQLPTPNFRVRNMDDLIKKGEEVDKNSESSYGSRLEFSSNAFEMEVNGRRRRQAYAEVLKSYDELQHRILNLEAAKAKLLSYTPGAWIENVGGMRLCDFDVPKTTTLLLIGPKGSGKSSLINRISRVFEDDKFASERAQVSYNSSIGDGTRFLHEYMIPRGSTSICIYDSRSLSFDSSEDVKILNQWMTKGVCHGELVVRDSEHSSFETKMMMMTHKARQSSFHSRERRIVNFVIFVVNGLSVLKSIDNDDVDSEAEACYTTMFDSPLLPFKDDKPVVVITHGDLLSLSDRARIRLHLGEVLGIPPKTQIFDIPECCDPAAELTITDMLRYSLERADRNLPRKGWLKSKAIPLRTYLRAEKQENPPSLLHCADKPPLVSEVSFPMGKLMLVVLGIVMISIIAAQIHKNHNNGISSCNACQPDDLHIDWAAIRHLWFD